MEGTKCRVVAELRSIASRIASGLASSFGGRSATEQPAISHQNSSHTETSKVAGVLWRMTSSGPSGYAFCIHSMRLTALPWLTLTPLGMPVEPEVKMT
nr:hypothetical protein [Paenibacillus sp. P22]